MRKCPACGSQQPDNTPACRCGEKLPALPPPLPGSAYPPDRFVYVFLGVAFFMLVLVLGVFFFAVRRGPPSAPSQTADGNLTPPQAPAVTPPTAPAPAPSEQRLIQFSVDGVAAPVSVLIPAEFTDPVTAEARGTQEIEMNRSRKDKDYLMDLIGYLARDWNSPRQSPSLCWGTYNVYSSHQGSVTEDEWEIFKTNQFAAYQRLPKPLRMEATDANSVVVFIGDHSARKYLYHQQCVLVFEVSFPYSRPAGFDRLTNLVHRITAPIMPGDDRSLAEDPLPAAARGSQRGIQFKFEKASRPTQLRIPAEFVEPPTPAAAAVQQQALERARTNDAARIVLTVGYLMTDWEHPSRSMVLRWGAWTNQLDHQGSHTSNCWNNTLKSLTRVSGLRQGSGTSPAAPQQVSYPIYDTSAPNAVVVYPFPGMARKHLYAEGDIVWVTVQLPFSRRNDISVLSNLMARITGARSDGQP